jgi:hypothetical protein
LLILIPWGAFWGKKIFSGDPWVQNISFIALGVSAFYLILGPGVFFKNLVLMLNNLVGCVVVGSILYFAFQNLYASRYD